MATSQEYLREIAPRIDSTYRGALIDAADRIDKIESATNALLDQYRGALIDAADRIDKMESATNALLDQIDRGDFVDSNGHSAKMLKAVLDLIKLMTPSSELGKMKGEKEL